MSHSNRRNWSDCAQRLTASEVWTLSGSISEKRAAMCSTPYGIRGLDTAVFNFAVDANEPCSTPYGIRGLDTKGHVDRLDHLSIGGCSTPYGIRGLDTSLSNAHPLIPYCVLNALRHQRFGHPPGLGKRRSPGPFSVLNALRHQRFGHKPDRAIGFLGIMSAQRLTASEVWTRLAVGGRAGR